MGKYDPTNFINLLKADNTSGLASIDDALTIYPTTQKKPVDEIASDINKILATKKSTAGMETPVTVGMPTEGYADNFIRYLNERRPTESVKTKRISLHNLMKDKFSNPPLTAEERLSSGWYEPIKSVDSDEKIIFDFKKLNVFEDEGKIYGDYTKWAKDRKSAKHVFDKNLDLMEVQFKKQLNELPESSKVLLNDPDKKGLTLLGQFEKAYEKILNKVPVYGSDVKGGHILSYKYIDALNERLGLNIPRSPRKARVFLTQMDFRKVPVLDPKNPDASKLSSALTYQLRNTGSFRNDYTLARAVKNNPEIKDKLQMLDNLFPDQKRLFELDHKTPLIFGGSTSPDNISIALFQPHRGTQIKSGKDVLDMKTNFENKVFKNYMNIVNEIKNGNIDNAKKISKQTEEFIKKTIDQKPSYSFGIGEPHNAYKVSEKLSESKYLNEIDLQLNDEQAAIARQLIKKYDYTPDILKTNLKGEARLVKELEKTFNMLVPYAGINRMKLKKLYPYKKGGLINGHSNDTRPHMAIGGDLSQFTEMEPVVPDLNAADAGYEFQMTKYDPSKFINPFKKKPQPKLFSKADETLKIEGKVDKDAPKSVISGDDSIFFLKSEESIKNAPQDVMMADQWLGYLKKSGVKPTELNEFGLENILKNLGGWEQVEKTKKGKKVLDKEGNVVMIDKWTNNVPITKIDLMKAYGDAKPSFTYKVLQKEPFEKGLKDYHEFLTGTKSGGRHEDTYNMPGSLKEFVETRNLKNRPSDLPGDILRSRIASAIRNVEDDYKTAWPKLEKEISSITNKVFKDYYGIDDVMKNGIPENAKIPFYSQNVFNRFDRLKKGEGFYMGKTTGVSHEGAQFLKGGTGYIEIPFTYNPNKKSVRSGEIIYKGGEGHFKNPSGNNPFFWTRVSERVDEGNRRVLLLEEIQSDIHQSVKQKKDHTYAPRLDDPGLPNVKNLTDQRISLVKDLEDVQVRMDKVGGHTDPSMVTIMERLQVKRESLRNQISKIDAEMETLGAKKGNENVYPRAPLEKSENQAMVAIKTIINMAQKEGYDGVVMITGKAKNHATGASGKVAKGNIGFYDNIASKAMKNTANKLGLDFSSTNIKDGDGNTWAKMPYIDLTGTKAETTSLYKEGGYVHRPSFVDVVPTL